VVEMGILSIPLLFALGALFIVLAGLGYEMASVWMMERERARRWGE